MYHLKAWKALCGRPLSWPGCHCRSCSPLLWKRVDPARAAATGKIQEASCTKETSIPINVFGFTMMPGMFFPCSTQVHAVASECQSLVYKANNLSVRITQHRYDDDDDLRRDPRRKNHTENDQSWRHTRKRCLDAGKDDPQLREHAPISVHSDLGVRPQLVSSSISQRDTWTVRSISVFALPSATHNNQSLL